MNKTLPAPLWLILLAGLVGAQSLEYQTYKANVEPIFLKKRPTRTRCVVCHASANHPFRLEPPNKGATTWAEAQSRKNFETVSQLVKPGEPFSSLLLIQPLAHSAGGAEFHSGGRQFASQDDPDWRAIAAWVNRAAVILKRVKGRLAGLIEGDDLSVYNCFVRESRKSLCNRGIS